MNDSLGTKVCEEVDGEMMRELAKDFLKRFPDVYNSPGINSAIKSGF